MALDIRVRKKLHYFDMDLDLSCEDGRMMVLIGPSGGGKTTLVRMLAGLSAPDEGRIVFHGETWFDSAGGINISPQKRRIGYVFQEFTLFPHLNLYENAAFAAVDKKEVDDLLDLFGIGHLRRRKPHLVSGGERQRCALCQALARRPRMLLLDEPFSALDAVTRRGLREELKSLKKRLDFPILYVTHDIGEALFLADEILPIVDGRIDREWMERTISREPAEGIPARAAREPRLALVY
ncbi:MAG: ATP-binding cassette domain-containing protein [Deltaproteobacteria bacterium]|nr:ATP-binding cassette domain-containing protein [Deltaproteobacteria bacterium]